MKIKVIYCIALAGLLALTGCISASYRGKSYKATKELAVYYSRSDLPKSNYQTMGELEITADTTCSSESIIRKIREVSMAKGADIAIIGWFDARFITEETKHKSLCRTSHCSHDAKDKYKHKKLIKVLLLKNKTTKKMK
jgi:hypothetical protein